MHTPGGEQTVTVTGLITDPPFTASEDAQIMICSEDLFEKLTGETGYTIIDMQLAQDASEEEVQAIRKMTEGSAVFTDDRISNRQVRGAYYSFALFFYGFLIIIALISVFNIINSIGMSVASRLRQYGAMRAIGMEIGQMVRMIMWETVTYLLSGSVTGCIAGVLLHWKLYDYHYHIPLGRRLAVSRKGAGGYPGGHGDFRCCRRVESCPENTQYVSDGNHRGTVIFFLISKRQAGKL